MTPAPGRTVLVDGQRRAAVLSVSTTDAYLLFPSGTRSSFALGRLTVVEDKDHPFGDLETK